MFSQEGIQNQHLLVFVLPEHAKLRFHSSLNTKEPVNIKFAKAEGRHNSIERVKHNILKKSFEKARRFKKIDVTWKEL